MLVETGISPISSKPCKGDISVETGITTFAGGHETRQACRSCGARGGDGRALVFYRHRTPTGFAECQFRSPGGTASR